VPEARECCELDEGRMPESISNRASSIRGKLTEGRRPEVMMM